MERGFSLIEALIVLLIVAVLAAIAIPIYQDSLLRAHTGTLTTDARALYLAMKQYHVDNHTYPETSDFDLTDFDPLGAMGYYTGAAWVRLEDEQADGYFGGGQEFWLELTLARDNSVRFLVSDSAGAPLSGGRYLDGVYLFVDGTLREVGQIN